jgi:hypothetical protein
MVQRSISIRREGKGLLAEMTATASPDLVWLILTSFEEMPEHLTILEQSRILAQEGTHRLVEQTASLELPLLPLSFRVVLDVLEERPFLYFSQREGSFTEFSGYWRVELDHSSGGSRIRYYLEVDIPRGLRRWAVDRHLRRMIQRNLQDLAIWIDEAGDYREA